MTKKIRLIILAVCVLLFIIITPYVVLYSLGYRIDFENKKIVTTGGIYVRVLPQGSEVLIDSKINNKTGLFSNSVFVQNLLPKQHSVLIKKDGYYNYQKNLLVKENEVTKLEHVILFKKNILFEILADKNQSPFNQPVIEDKYIIKNSNLYYSSAKENANITLLQKNTSIIKNLVSFKVLNNNIIWLALDGLLYSSDINGKNAQNLSEIKLKINNINIYKIFTFDQEIFLKNNNSLLLLNKETKAFSDFYGNVRDLKTSPNSQKLLYYNDHEILLSDMNQLNSERTLLNRFSNQINDCYWINDDYIIIQLEDKILISEINVIDKVNTVELPKAVSLTDGTNVDLKNIKILFNQQEKKLYILNQKNTLISERLIP
ncbi:MAG: hypothetical protein A3C58_03210 [Candidatus Staskawiczbacteria bacterium RIFCSPHIGHO2_02_FULL_34_10]|uniref:PEGA domain-containing protein n=2 Tax=Candidatus Staskawicziibacteriota TaxID=1817916 RepID=A0A1G2HIT3_9BACT|nr:MAG: hypothetical protein A2639_01090 [Candidatus Staskawiczbacteria bacterium RIFCSPHIGHO2_01_FULL_34_27]OGZ67797.1 MAG: hypothetical protein A3C58_03210 [Candidatus Staskawiczbacteria bacterium RIFCSPHIGHO2_02_FULL_34_10]